MAHSTRLKRATQKGRPAGHPSGDMSKNFSVLGAADHLGVADHPVRLGVAEPGAVVAEHPAPGPVGFLPAPLSGLRRRDWRCAAAAGAEAAPAVPAAAAASAAAAFPDREAAH